MRFREDLKLVIENALQEDIGSGDYTSLACVPEQHIGKAKLIVKDTGIIAGVEFAKEVFSYIDSSIIFNPLCKDGDEVNYGDIAFYVYEHQKKNIQTILYF